MVGAHSLEEMVSKLKKPRRIILLVKAGQAVDDFIEKLVRPALLSAATAGTELFSFLPLTILLKRIFPPLKFLDMNCSVLTKHLLECLSVG